MAAAENHGIIFPASGRNACGDEYLYQFIAITLMRTHYSNAIRNATAVAHGEDASEIMNEPPSKDRCSALPIPAILLVTAPAPNINTGTKRGSTRRATS